MDASHLHFMATAPGLRSLVTHIFVEGDGLLASDAVFGVRDSLVKRFEQHPADTPTPDGRDLSGQADQACGSTSRSPHNPGDGSVIHERQGVSGAFRA
ncbi:hypothetical protein GCM10010306_095820 [Streptomyces umbrinus]|nr:hypothetical protein GCM10010306_095820 [Streptomyces umbrinus]